MKVSVIGQGYVGLPLALAAASVGHEVFGIDTNVELINSLSAKYKVSNYFPVSNHGSIKDCEVVIICVPTPLDEYGKPDISVLKNAVETVSQLLNNGSMVIIESTIAPGTTRTTIKNTLDKFISEYSLVYSPERIDPGNKTWGVTNTPKLVAGIDNESTDRALNFYKSFIKDVIACSSIEVVETAKLLENTFRYINISFINEFSDFCRKMNIDTREVIEAAATKPYGFMPFYPSAGIGGHCIPVDPSYLAAKANELGAQTKFIDLASQVNISMGDYFAKIAENKVGILLGKKIILVGVSYKPNVPDTRETPAQRIMNSLKSKGALVFWHDELVKEWIGESSTELNTNFDLAILINPHSDTDLSKLGNIEVIDTRGGY
jgi:UDP-N-acetyl-D-glucosamine dehydrogenase